MTYPSTETLSLAALLRENLAGSNLPPQIAKLYSQYTKLREGQKGLTRWGQEETTDRLTDAVRLLEAAFIERESGGSEWTNSVRRAGELLEWLSHPQLSPQGLPTRLLAAAAYQLAGYPARSTGLLNDDTLLAPESTILRSFLRADFPDLMSDLTDYWAAAHSDEIGVSHLPWEDVDAVSIKLQQWVIQETASSLGIIGASMRWGYDARLQIALDKLLAVGKVVLHWDTPYSWLLAKLCGEAAQVYVDTSLRKHLQNLFEGVTDTGKAAFERYARLSYLTHKALAWPSQIRGITNLASGRSFALCTPTGSGKTTIAELSILQSLFPASFATSNTTFDVDNPAPIALYLVPSRALAAEVESKLSRVLKRIDQESEIIVTGLYGGTDWGPTDAWLTADKRTVLICTYEKAEALIRFLGTLFLSRVTLIVIDEAHSIQFDGKEELLRSAESRSLRLESLGTRLLTHLDRNRGRVIALSAVAAGVESALASWVAGRKNELPAIAPYRSTRQLIGRLECFTNGTYEIHYDLLDGANLEFEDRGGRERPYIPNAFPQCPRVERWKNADGWGKRLRPQLFWAAMNLASRDDTGQQRAVLISITQGIDGYAEDLINLLEATWSTNHPTFFSGPIGPRRRNLWARCLESCKDYYGEESREYRLLNRGVVVHHGKMPGLMARLLVEVVQERIVHLVLATSTLSEGVNLPFEVVLIPSLSRYEKDIDVREFSNLVGRAGRPGFATEGRSLIVLPQENAARNSKEILAIKRARLKYFKLVHELQTQGTASNSGSRASSPLAGLLVYLWRQWFHFSGSNSLTDFFAWLEQTAPLEIPEASQVDDPRTLAVQALDSLDSLLLSIIVEAEQVESKDLTADELEGELKQVWQRSYAHFASAQEARLQDFFVVRGKAVKEKIYPDIYQRRRLYKTSLPPRAGQQLLNSYNLIKQYFEPGKNYADWDPQQRFQYIQVIVEQLTSLRKFTLPVSARDKTPWYEKLHWWLDPSGAPAKPGIKQISVWHDYIHKNFAYKFNWGLGSVVALALNDAYGGELRETSLEDWSKTGLPWIVFWLKELITWGTLEPVAAYILSQGMALTREKAETLAASYYLDLPEDQESDDVLNASKIRQWAQSRLSAAQSGHTPTLPENLNVTLLRDFTNVVTKQWRVVPVLTGDEIRWFDPAGYPLALSQQPTVWTKEYLSNYDFMLDTEKQIVHVSTYL